MTGREGPDGPDPYVGLDGARHERTDAGPPPEDFDLIVRGTVEPGHGVASGRNGDPRFPGGTLRLQPHFLARGLDLGACYPGTLNVSVAPRRFRIGAPTVTLRAVAWSDVLAAESFFFAACYATHAGRSVAGYVYQPDPATKSDHPDDPAHLQVVAPLLPPPG